MTTNATVRGSSPYYTTELMTSRHYYALASWWVVCFIGLIYLLARSDDLQYDCFPFCDTATRRSCVTQLHSVPMFKVASPWEIDPSACIDMHVTNTSSATNASNITTAAQVWSSSAGPDATSLSTLSSASAQDVIPELQSTGRRIGRFILQFNAADYVPTAAAATAVLHCVALVDEGGGLLLTPPTVLMSYLFSGVFRVDLSSGSAAMIFELPIGYRLPAGTQQFVLEFPAGPPLKAVNATTAPGTSGPLQLTFATSSPTYLMYEMFARYVLLVVTCAVVVLVMCLHALSDTATYEVFHPSVPSFDGWFACFSTVLFVMERESLVRDVWPRLPLIVKWSIGCLVSVAFLCDPLVGAYYAFPGCFMLQLWFRTIMPWARLTWMVLTSAWLLACMMTCGDGGKMYTTSTKDTGVVSTPPSTLSTSPKLVVTTPVAEGLGVHTSASSQPHLPSGLVEQLAKLPLQRRSLLAGCTLRKMTAVVLAAAAPSVYFMSVVVSAIKGSFTTQPQPSSGVMDETLTVSSGVPLVGMLTGLPMLVGFWYYHQRTLFAQFPRGVADVSAQPSYGTPSTRGSGRQFVLAVRLLLPFCVWACMFTSLAYIGTHGARATSTMLPSYNNGHLVEVLLTVLMGWTVALAFVPLRRGVATHPVRPSIFPTHRGHQGAAFRPDVPLWCQLPWRHAYASGLASGALPNCGFGFHTEEHELAFAVTQREYAVDNMILRLGTGGGVARPPVVQHPLWLPTFCWETAVRCVNISNETYNELDGEADLLSYAQTEAYDPTEWEECVMDRCCCCLNALRAGGCGGRGRDVDDVLPSEAVAAAVMTPVMAAVAYHQHVHHFTGERTPFVMAPSARRFSEAGSIAVDASRNSVARTRRRRPPSPSVSDAANEIESDAVKLTFVAPAKPIVPVNSKLTSKRPPPIALLVPSGGASSGEPLQADIEYASEKKRSTTTTATTDDDATPLALVNWVAPKGQINVTRFGYDLVKVLDVYGVRMIIAATPPGTTGRHPHLSIAFRGTVNLRNAMTNVNARTAGHPEVEDGDAEVHSGFNDAFQVLLPTLTAALQDFYFTAHDDSGAWEASPWGAQLTHVVTTGHSLGGALAMLCAYSIAQGALCKDVFDKLPSSSRPLLRCYTFGSPRIGNVSFADVYNRAVPATFRVINENDVVAHVGLCWHEHCGREVRLNRDGDAVIEGTYLEQAFSASLTQGVGSSLKNHLLDRYGNSLDNCLCARNLNLLSPDCCSFMMVHVDEEGG